MTTRENGRCEICLYLSKYNLIRKIYKLKRRYSFHAPHPFLSPYHPLITPNSYIPHPRSRPHSTIMASQGFTAPFAVAFLVSATSISLSSFTSPPKPLAGCKIFAFRTV